MTLVITTIDLSNYKESYIDDNRIISLNEHCDILRHNGHKNIFKFTYNSNILKKQKLCKYRKLFDVFDVNRALIIVSSKYNC